MNWETPDISNTSGIPLYGNDEHHTGKTNDFIYTLLSAGFHSCNFFLNWSKRLIYTGYNCDWYTHCETMFSIQTFLYRIV